MKSLEIAGISPAEIEKWKAKGFGKLKIDKTGDDATAEAAVLSRWINVTPQMAREWLKNNFRNRPISDEVVASYARDIVNGLWQPTHQGIAFNDRDELIDGQHRLRAVIMANKTVRMMVTFGLPSKIEGSQMTTMDCVDRGRTRSVADQLKIQHGLKNGTYIAQLGSALAGLCSERIRRLSVGQTLDIYREFKVGMDLAIACRSKLPGLRSAGVLAAFAFSIEPDKNREIHLLPQVKMFQALNMDDGLDKYPVMKLLRDFLTGENAALIISSMNRGIAELTAWAIHAELAHQKVAELEKDPAQWLAAVEVFRKLQPDRVARVAAMFALPKTDTSPAVTTPSGGISKAKAQMPAGEKMNTCECGKHYPGRKNNNGCPDCRKDFLAGHHRDKKIKASREFALSESADV